MGAASTRPESVEMRRREAAAYAAALPSREETRRQEKWRYEQYEKMCLAMGLTVEEREAEVAAALDSWGAELAAERRKRQHSDDEEPSAKKSRPLEEDEPEKVNPVPTASSHTTQEADEPENKVDPVPVISTQPYWCTEEYRNQSTMPK